MPKQKIDLEDTETVKAGFWKRQFQLSATPGQKGFDWFFGVVLPVICVAADPIVFKGLGLMSGGPILGGYKSFAYLLSFTSIMAMIAWLLFREKLKGFNAVLAGLFVFGGVISFAVGVILLPFSLLGLLVLIGALGFTPLFAGFVYLRNSFRAFHVAKPFFETRVLLSTFLLTALLSGVVPFVINVEIDRRMDNMVRGNAQSIYMNAARLKFYAPLVDFSVIARAYCSTQDKEKQRALADVYNHYSGTTDRSIDFNICNRD